MAQHLIVGGDGLLGGALFDLLRRDSADVHRTTRRPGKTAAFALDLATPGCSVEGVPGLDRLADSSPRIVYLAAAISGYAQCDADPAATRQVNVVNLVRIAKEFVRRGAFVVFPSSTAVFSGSRRVCTEADATDPASEYGRQKAEAEARLRGFAANAATGAGVAIVRLTKVVAPDAGVVAAWIRDLRAGRSIEAAQDLRFAPISVMYAARNLVRLGERRQSGTFHLSGKNDMSYLEFARLLAARLGAPAERVVPVSISDRLHTGAISQPGVLDMARTSTGTGIRPQKAEDVVVDLTADAADCG